MADTLKIYLIALLVSGDHMHSRIWPDLAFGFVDKSQSVYEIKLFAAVAIVVTYAPDLTMDVRLCVKWMLCGVRFSRSTLFWYSLFQNRKKLLQIEQSTY